MFLVEPKLEDLDPTVPCDDLQNNIKAYNDSLKEINSVKSLDETISFDEIVRSTAENIQYDGFEFGKQLMLRKGIACFPCVNHRSTRCQAAIYLDDDTFKSNEKNHNHWRKNEGHTSISTAIAEGGLDYMGFKYHKSGVVKNGVVYYRCSKFRSKRCPATLQVEGEKYRTNQKHHNHTPKEKSDALSGRKLCYDGFYFYRHGKCEFKIYWRCSTFGCCVRLHTNLDGSFISIRGEHKHSN